MLKSCSRRVLDGQILGQKTKLKPYQEKMKSKEGLSEEESEMETHKSYLEDLKSEKERRK